METLGIEEEQMIGPAKCSYKPTTIIGPNSRASNSQNFGAKVSNQNFPPKCKTSKIKEKRNSEREREREREKSSSTMFIAVQCCQCSTMQAKFYHLFNCLLSLSILYYT